VRGRRSSITGTTSSGPCARALTRPISLPADPMVRAVRARSTTHRCSSILPKTLVSAPTLPRSMPPWSPISFAKPKRIDGASSVCRRCSTNCCPHRGQERGKTAAVSDLATGGKEIRSKCRQVIDQLPAARLPLQVLFVRGAIEGRERTSWIDRAAAQNPFEVGHVLLEDLATANRSVRRHDG